MPEEVPDLAEDWSAERRAALVLSILKGEVSAREAASIHGLSLDQVNDWKRRFLARLSRLLLPLRKNKPISAKYPQRPTAKLASGSAR